MPLLGPNKHDLQKLHAEVNQIESQRFVLTTVAITAFAAIASFVAYTPAESRAEFAYLASALILVLLSALYVYGHLLKRVLRIYTTYLKVTGASPWESDYRAYRDHLRFTRKRMTILKRPLRWHWGYDQGQFVVFLALGVLAWVLPLLFVSSAVGWATLSNFFDGPYGYNLNLLLIAVFCTVITVPVLAPFRRWDERNIERQWQELKDSQGRTEA